MSEKLEEILEYLRRRTGTAWRVEADAIMGYGHFYRLDRKRLRSVRIRESNLDNYSAETLSAWIIFAEKKGSSEVSLG